MDFTNAKIMLIQPVNHSTKCLGCYHFNPLDHMIEDWTTHQFWGRRDTSGSWHPASSAPQGAAGSIATPRVWIKFNQKKQNWIWRRKKSWFSFHWWPGIRTRRSGSGGTCERGRRRRRRWRSWGTRRRQNHRSRCCTWKRVELIGWWKEQMV